MSDQVLGRTGPDQVREPIRNGSGASIIGPRNPSREAENPNILSPPRTDAGSLIRLDVRSTDDGRLMVLEANAKPDLTRPTNDATSLVCAGLYEYGMDYDDLILSLLADRLDGLFTQRRASVRHLIDLLD